jgi:hypothetical protein
MLSLNKKVEEKIENDRIDRKALERVLKLFEKNLDGLGFEIVGSEFKNGELHYLVKIKNR